MTQNSFLERLRQGKPLLADGAMGTMLHGRGLPMDACFDELNLTRPELISGIHRDYVEAGAELIETNTFSANRYKLAECGAEDKVIEINRAGAALARKAIVESQKTGVFVAGSVGPLGV